MRTTGRDSRSTWSKRRRTGRRNSRSKCGSTDVVAPIGGAPSGERLRFKDFLFQRLASGRCRSKVVLAWADGRQFVGEADGVTSQAGELRCSAHACVQAPEGPAAPRLALAQFRGQTRLPLATPPGRLHHAPLASDGSSAHTGTI